MSITSQVELVTPEVAARYLEGNVHNRPLSHRHVMELVKEINEGAGWRLNGESIKFDASGTLLDGQHRLYAVMEANRPVQMLVVRGLDPEVASTLDTGKRRSPSDVLHLSGVRSGYNTTLAAAIRLILQYRRGELWTPYKPTNREILAFQQANQGLVDWVHRMRAKGPLRNFASATSAVMYLGCQHQSARAVEFAEALITGAGMERGHPALAVRERLLSGRHNYGTPRFVVTVIGWNAFVEGRQVYIIRPPADRTCPKIRGDYR